MKTAFTETGWEDYLYWQEADTDKLERINLLIRSIHTDPFKGIGKPEPLKNKLSGWWSRRITDEHRLIYRVEGKRPDQTVTIIQARFHYSD
jgi:toxin YoeB